MGYANPYLCEDGQFFAQASGKGYLALAPGGGPYLTKSTSFPFGIVDLSNQAAYEWLKAVVKENMLGLGLRGWMADFGRDEERAFLLGRDLAVYPVLEEEARSRRLRLPSDRWTGLFDGREYAGGELELPAPLGSPPVFCRRDSAFAPLFASLRG